MKAFYIFLTLWLLTAASFGLCAFQAQGVTSTTARVDQMEDSIANCQHQVIVWEREEKLEIAFAILLIVFGIVIPVVDKSKAKWASAAVLVLGVSSSILTAINTRVLDADYRTLQRAVFEGNAIVSQLHVLAQVSEDDQALPKDRQAARESFLNNLTKFEAIGEGLNGAQGIQQRAQSAEGIWPSVYAQSTEPVWVRTPPQDSASLYFVGSDTDSNLSSAKENSLDDAYHSAVVALRSKAAKASDPALLALVKGSGVVRDSAVAYNPSTKNYTSYTLLALSNQIESIGIASASPADTAQSPRTRFQQAGWQPTDLTYNPTAGMFALDASGAISQLVASPQGAPQ
jgi:hypothetical protein